MIASFPVDFLETKINCKKKGIEIEYSINRCTDLYGKFNIIKKNNGKLIKNDIEGVGYVETLWQELRSNKEYEEVELYMNINKIRGIK